jgi:hypothetical protein
VLLRLACWAAAGWRSLLSAPPGDGPFTQHSPAHRRAASPYSVCRNSLFNYEIISPKLTSLSLF